MKNQILLPLAAMLIGSPVLVLAGCGAGSSAGSKGSSSNGSSGSLRLSTSALSFNGSSGNVSSQPVTMTATGSSSVTITKATFSNGTFSAPLPDMPVTLSSGQSLTAQISAKPASTAQTGTVTIDSSAGTYVISLSETAKSAGSTSHEASLTWDAPASNSDPVDSYQVDRADAGSSSYSVVGTTTAASTTFTDTSVKSGKSYTYEIRSVDASGNKSSPSNAITISVP